jgi:hypothetical protein
MNVEASNFWFKYLYVILSLSYAQIFYMLFTSSFYILTFEWEMKSHTHVKVIEASVLSILLYVHWLKHNQFVSDSFTWLHSQ